MSPTTTTGSSDKDQGEPESDDEEGQANSDSDEGGMSPDEGLDTNSQPVYKTLKLRHVKVFIQQSKIMGLMPCSQYLY